MRSTTTISIDTETLRLVRERAKTNGDNISHICERAMEAYIGSAAEEANILREREAHLRQKRKKAEKKHQEEQTEERNAIEEAEDRMTNILSAFDGVNRTDWSLDEILKKYIVHFASLEPIVRRQVASRALERATILYQQAAEEDEAYRDEQKRLEDLCYPVLLRAYDTCGNIEDVNLSSLFDSAGLLAEWRKLVAERVIERAKKNAGWERDNMGRWVRKQGE